MVKSVLISSLAQLTEAVIAHPAVIVRGGGSKPGLRPAAPAAGAPAGAPVELDLRGLSGIVEYDPGEYVFTAWAGTPLAEIEQALAAHGQYLPFTPPLAQAGATLGGTIAAGLSGAGRQRYGGVRDFLIGVRFVDGQGRLVRGGGKVVKNAAGFDLPKLMVGSCGRLGALAEVSFKVFPRPHHYATLLAEQPAIADAMAIMTRLGRAPLDLEALDLVFAAGGPCHVAVRIGGDEALLAGRLAGLQQIAGRGETLMGDEDAAFWHAADAFAWASPAGAFAKVVLTPAQVAPLDERLAAVGSVRRYSSGGYLGWVAWPTPERELDALLQELGLSGLLLRGAAPSPWLGKRTGVELAERVRRVLDPHHRFPEF